LLWGWAADAVRAERQGRAGGENGLVVGLLLCSLVAAGLTAFC
jgi:hypothetical protein